MPDNLTIMDKRMLLLLGWLKEAGIIKFNKDYLEVLEIKRQNYSKIERGEGHFTASQILKVCTAFDIDANWIYGFTDKNILRKKGVISLKKRKMFKQIYKQRFLESAEM